MIQTIELGTLNRDPNGRFTKTYTLSYETHREGSSEVVKVERRLPARSIERIGKVINRAADKGTVWNIEVLDASREDVTSDFACFQD